MNLRSFSKTLFINFFYLNIYLYGPCAFAQLKTQDTIHFRINLNLKLPNILSYELTITNLKKGHLYNFRLNRGLEINSLGQRDKLVRKGSNSSSVEYEFKSETDEIGQFDVTGILSSEDAIGPKMMVLSSSSEWFPSLASLMSYDLSINIDEQSKSYSPSQREEKCGTYCNRYIETRPQEDIYVVFGKLTEYRKQVDKKTIGVLLLNPDDQLAERYLDLLPEFIARYELKLGEYPYKAFYVVENFNETGFGMPGFTLMGQNVLRLPFILHSSLPHEVLHNWWGNSVFVDFKRGNWCEGLTTYGADHFEQELLGNAPQYRRDALVGFENFVKSDKDFPLQEFRGRHNEASQAIGYSKGMMLFHMVRKWVGEQKFFDSLKLVVSSFQFKRIGFEELGDVFSEISGEDETKTFFNSWVNGLGAVDIVAEQQCSIEGNPEILIRSTPRTLNYILPYKIENEKTEQHREVKVINGAQRILLPNGFLGKVTLDPQYDVFRKLRKGEKPLTLSGLLSSEKIYVLSEVGLESESRDWIKGLNSTFKGEANWIESIENAEPNSHLVIYGFKNLSVANKVLPHLQGNMILNGSRFEIGGQVFSASQSGWIIMAFDKVKDLTITWVSKPNEVLAENWGKQLLHYSKFGILFFEGKTNKLKTSWAEDENGLPIQIIGCKI